MKSTNATQILKTVKKEVTKKSPVILTGIGIAGMVTTTVLAVKATPKALTLIEEKKKADGVEELKVIDTVKICWKPYIPSMVTCIFSVSCLIGANSVNARRNAALAAAYKLSETAFMDYKEKVIETIGEKKEKTVKDKVAKDKVEKNPVSNASVIITDKGNTLCYDAISGRYFKSDIDLIKRATNELNRQMMYSDYISLNELYGELGLDSTVIGDQLGWNISDGLIEPSFSSQLADDGTPCIVLDYDTAPRYDYSKLT